MIKRRFYKFEHGDKDAPSESSSSFDSELEPEATNETEVEEEEEEENVVTDERHKGETSTSGYESEDSSANEVNLDSSGLATSDDDAAPQNGGQNIVGTIAISEADNVFERVQNTPERNESPFDVKDCVIKCKSVFKCRLCPRIVCLSEETLKAHLNSKRHARSEKLHREGRLKIMLNNEGQIEGEIHPDKHDATPVSGQSPTKSEKIVIGRWKLRKRSKQQDREKQDNQRRSAGRDRRINE